MVTMTRQRQSGFTTIELLLILVLIAILSALILSSRAGIQQNKRNTERQTDIKELRDGLEGYFAANNHYPTIDELNNVNWRSTHLKALDSDVFKDPKATGNSLATKPQTNVYAYMVTSASGTACGTAQDPCTQYTLTATLEGGGLYTKNNLN
jgi:type II secretory pathway pseudopilin PulG